jgi:hypothetical protein
MELQIVETVLTDMLEEQKTTNQLNQELAVKLKELEEKVTAFDQKLETIKVMAPAVDIVPVQRIIEDGLLDVAQMVEAQPKNVIRQVRLLLFPETNAGQYYKIVFGRLIPWAYAFAGVTFLFSLGKKYMESSNALQQRRYYFEVYKDAWDRLDTTLDRAGRTTMKRVMQKAVNDAK